jgi:hypothetical protein
MFRTRLSFGIGITSIANQAMHSKFFWLSVIG